ncbi:hypothetical protein L596_006536 [Steinernema carpocapsae]|uniref:C3H1-type domain-containing protein n=1 Tax=Steinernema carpocapsae TaxID=34508 RepID=A0A4U8V4W7_STECR|nr:hypothetical protein L596_006536 [Steinernema carpocapsae]
MNVVITPTVVGNLPSLFQFPTPPEGILPHFVDNGQGGFVTVIPEQGPQQIDTPPQYLGPSSPEEQQAMPQMLPQMVLTPMVDSGVSYMSYPVQHVPQVNMPGMAGYPNTGLQPFTMFDGYGMPMVAYPQRLFQEADFNQSTNFEQHAHGSQFAQSGRPQVEQVRRHSESSRSGRNNRFSKSLPFRQRSRRNSSTSTRLGGSGPPLPRRCTDEEARRAYKTMICEMYERTGDCNYGNTCRFAHGEADLRPRCNSHSQVMNSSKFKTVMCNKIEKLGTCPYGKRCLFIHPDDYDENDVVYGEETEE